MTDYGDMCKDLREMRREIAKQARLLGIGGTRESALMAKVDAITRERDEARAEIERLITEVERLRGRLIGKRAIFQAGRDSYKTNCQPMNTDDEAWAEFVVSQEAKP